MVNAPGLSVDTHMHAWKIEPPRYTLEQTLVDVPLPTTDATIEDVLAAGGLPVPEAPPEAMPVAFEAPEQLGDAGHRG